jgi:prepilin-type N-terminal cleavage/methylation domain-containing protein
MLKGKPITMFRRIRSQDPQGFTLMEMLIVVTIIGILASIILPRFVATSAAADKSAHKAERQTINAQLELFYFQNSEWPVSGNLSNWSINYLSYFPEGVPATCNKGAIWKVSSGRIIMDDQHTSHE